MEAKFWQQKWDDGQIGFHQSDTNKRLIRFWPEVVEHNEAARARNAGTVFVPLCGKTLDMLWLHQQGHKVLGVELSVKAAEAFFKENNLDCDVQEKHGFVHYTGTGGAEGICLLVGDIFELSAELCTDCSVFYDRAAMIAMNPEMRIKYAKNLARIIPERSRGLLLSISYNQAQMKGPPFSVSDENVRHLLHENFSIQELAHYSGPKHVGNLAERGLETLDERVYLLDRYNTT